ncbi:MAG: RipA family octameric membrane protein [Armatimonadota bacterium]
MATVQKELDGLLSKSKKQYGDLYEAHLFEQYKILVDSTQRISDRRISANTYLLTVNSFLVTLFGIAKSTQYHGVALAVIPLVGLFISIAWWILIDSYKVLNSAKFDVIHKFEDLLPVAVFRYEWDVLTKMRYKPLSHAEGWIPVAFSILQVVLLIIAIKM